MKDTVMSAKAVLTCRPNSHPFEDRNFTLEQPVKIGRSVARSRPNSTNAIFDCKVLSRNHALLWYENGKFFLQDTKSSNGTFVNNQRLSKSSEESLPFQVSSGDILQFGVDVMEVTKKDPTNSQSIIDAVTHGCIVATLTLYLPDGKEAKASSSAQLVDKSQHPTTHEMYQINQIVREALQREQLIDTKMKSVTDLLGSTTTMMADNWKSLIEEDRLITKVDGLQRQLQMSHKNTSEDKLREEIRQLHEDKEKYQSLAKQKLKEHAMKKLESLTRVNEIETKLTVAEEECQTLKELYDRTSAELSLMAQKFDDAEKKAAELAQELNLSKDNYKEELDRLNKNLKDEHDRLVNKHQLLDTLLGKLDSQNSTTANNSIKTLLLSLNSSANSDEILSGKGDELSSILNNNSQHNNNILVDSSQTVSANVKSDNSNHHHGPTVVVDEIDDEELVPEKNPAIATKVDNVDAVRNQYLNNENSSGSCGLDLQQLQSILTDLLGLCEEFRKISADNNYSETIVQLISKVSRDIRQVRNITKKAEDAAMHVIKDDFDSTIKKGTQDKLLQDEGDNKSNVETAEIDKLSICDGINVGKNANELNVFGNVKKEEFEDADELNGNQILSEAREQVKALQNEKNQLLEKIETLQTQSGDSLKRARLYENIAKDLERVSHEQGLQLKALKEQMAEAEKSYSGSHVELKSKDEIIAANQSTILQLRDELSALQEYKNEQDERVALLRSQINDLSQKNSNTVVEEFKPAVSPPRSLRSSTESVATVVSSSPSSFYSPSPAESYQPRSSTPTSLSNDAQIKVCNECLSPATQFRSRRSKQRNSSTYFDTSANDISALSGSSDEILCSDCYCSKYESHNDKLRTELQDVAARLLEAEEELSIFKEQFNKSSSHCSHLERELAEQKSFANNAQWVSLKWMVPLLIIILAVLIVFHPNS